MERPAAPARVTRGLVVAGAGLGFAAAAHQRAGGTVPISPLVVLAALLVAVGCVLASEQLWTRTRLIAALLGVQLAVHGALWFDSGGRTVDARLGAVAAPVASHAHDAAPPTSSYAMLLAHVCAVLLAAVLLAAVDASLLVLRAMARRILGARVPVLPTLRPAPLTGRHGVIAHGLAELGAVGRRGPPAWLAPA